MKTKRQKGYSLQETVIAMAITAILASVAVPTYQEHWARHKIKQVQLHLLELQTLQERYRLVNGIYAQASELGISAYNGFEISVEDVGIFTYTLVATNQASQSVNCAQLKINHDFIRSPGHCWD